MAKVKIQGNASGTGIITVTAPNTSTDRTITLPDNTGALITNSDNFPAANLTGTVATAQIAADAVTGAKIADDSIDSEHIVDGSIDTAHIGDDQVTAAKLANSINTDIATGVTANTTANNALPKAGGTMTGNLVMPNGGTIGSASDTDAISIASNGETSFTSGVKLADNKKIKFGGGEDLEIYHDGSNSFISEASGTGTLYIRGTDIILKSGADNDDYIKCHENSDVKLYYSNAEKLATTSSGVSVTGTLAATAVTGDGSGLTNLPGGGKIGQVVQTTSTSQSYSNSASDTNFLSCNITPSATNSKVLIMTTWFTGNGNNETYYLMRNSTKVGGIGSGGNGMKSVGSFFNADADTGVHDQNYSMSINSYTYLDSPSSTSQVTYHLGHMTPTGSSDAFYINRTQAGTGSGQGTMTMTLMEVLA